MTVTSNQSKGSFVAFIPYKLDIAGRPELSLFPLNVLFAKYKTVDGNVVIGKALYEPDLKSLSKKGTVFRMTYRNAYGGDGRLIIRYDFLKEKYQGEKFVRGESVGQAEGTEWDRFFMQFGVLGISDGERGE